MLKRWSVIVGAAVVALIGLWVYFAYGPMVGMGPPPLAPEPASRIPPGVEPMGDEGQTIAWVALVTSIVSLLTALTGLVQKLIELRES